MSQPDAETFVLLGPKPEVAPSWLESHGLALAASLAVLAILAWGIIRLLRRQSAERADPAEIFRAQLAAARSAATHRRAALAADALRTYLAALTPAAATGLTTEELAAAAVRSPLLATATDPILRALRAADRAKFAGSADDGAETLALAELAFANLELARQALWKEISA